MYITVQQTKENGDLSLSYQNGQNLTLRYEPDFDVDNYSLSAIQGYNGRYETTTSITASGNYKLFRNGIEDKGFGGNQGKYLISENNLLDANDFNVGETIICQSISGTKYFVPIDLQETISNSVSSVTASLSYFTYKAKVRANNPEENLEILAVYQDTWESGQFWSWNGTGIYTSNDFDPDVIYTEDKFHEFNEWFPVYDNRIEPNTPNEGLLGYYRLNLYLTNASIVKIETVDKGWNYSDDVFRYGQTITFQYNR